MKNPDFAIFILTHARPNNIKTIKTLKKCGYTGLIYFIIDNEDKTRDKYIRNFGEEKVHVFDKKYYADLIDEGNNFDERRTITHARNASFDIAKKIGITYFMELDDDYTAFHFRFPDQQNEKLLFKSVPDLDYIISLYLDFYKKTKFKSIAFAQGGDFIGGVGNPTVIRRPLMRKCMNSFICSTERKFQFVGAMNEDVNTYTTLGSRGNLFGTVPMVNLVQEATQSNSGGITDMYLKYGTYCKSFTTVIMMPSSVKVSMMNSNNPRLHHQIKWENTVPKIIDEKHSKIKKNENSRTAINRGI